MSSHTMQPSVRGTVPAPAWHLHSALVAGATLDETYRFPPSWRACVFANAPCPCLARAPQNRFVIYKKGLEGEVDVQPPKLLGEKGVKSPAYLALNPQVPDACSLASGVDWEGVKACGAAGRALLPPSDVNLPTTSARCCCCLLAVALQATHPCAHCAPLPPLCSCFQGKMPLLVLPDGTPLPESNVRLRRSGAGCGCGWLRLAAVWCQLRGAQLACWGPPNCAHPFNPVHVSSCAHPCTPTNQSRLSVWSPPAGD